MVREGNTSQLVPPIQDQPTSRLFNHLDQSRYSYLPPISTEGISSEMYAPPLPASPVYTKMDCSESYVAVMQLQEEFNVEYAAAIGSLIW
jgi:hypothetical protein